MTYKQIKKLQDDANRRYRCSSMNIEPIRQLIYKENLSDADVDMLQAFMNLPNGKLNDLCVHGNVIYNADPIKRTIHRIKRKKSKSDK